MTDVNQVSGSNILKPQVEPYIRIMDPPVKIDKNTLMTYMNHADFKHVRMYVNKLILEICIVI